MSGIGNYYHASSSISYLDHHLYDCRPLYKHVSRWCLTRPLGRSPPPPLRRSTRPWRQCHPAVQTLPTMCTENEHASLSKGRMGSPIVQPSGSARPCLQAMRWLTWRGDEPCVRLLVQCGEVSGCGGGHSGAADVEATRPQPSEHTARITIGTTHHPATTPVSDSCMD